MGSALRCIGADVLGGVVCYIDKNRRNRYLDGRCNISLPYGVEPLIFEAEFTQEGELLLETARIRRISRNEAYIEAALVDNRLKSSAEKMRQEENAVQTVVEKQL